jgi:histone-lysine N-methyltransferase SETDB1
MNRESEELNDSDQNDQDDTSNSNSNMSTKKDKTKCLPSKSNTKLNDSYQRPKPGHNKTSKSKEIELIYLDSDEDEQEMNSRKQQITTQKEEESFKNRVMTRQIKDKKTEDIILRNRFFTNENNPFCIYNFKEQQEAYIMDAKSWGNIGRWFNHSCTPNIFVQNVFIDTYDLKFPWIAFFSIQSIKAGTELCWDYNYTIDSVKGRVLYCYCNSANCRGRLL